MFFFFKELIEIPGCLASKDKSLMNILITKKQKEVLIAMNKMLIDIFSTKENVKPKPATRISAHSLEKLVDKFKNIDNLHTITESSKKLQVCVPMMEYYFI